ncbi:MAG: helix-turn-helix domain-containing protein, partial [Oscillospiraceae bacterium]|nr:helix-turn-helix domain-containing protein [Oscillospiraceae bacterium]
MNKFTILSVVLEFIEENLTQTLTPELCAKKCGYSLSNLQKMFRCVFHIGIGDYISRRKLTLAAKDLLETESSVLEIAVKYGYNSH